MLCQNGPSKWWLCATIGYCFCSCTCVGPPSSCLFEQSGYVASRSGEKRTFRQAVTRWRAWVGHLALLLCESKVIDCESLGQTVRNCHSCDSKMSKRFPMTSWTNAKGLWWYHCRKFCFASSAGKGKMWGAPKDSATCLYHIYCTDEIRQRKDPTASVFYGGSFVVPEKSFSKVVSRTPLILCSGVPYHT